MEEKLVTATEQSTKKAVDAIDEHNNLIAGADEIENGYEEQEEIVGGAEKNTIENEERVAEKDCLLAGDDETSIVNKIEEDVVAVTEQNATKDEMVAVGMEENTAEVEKEIGEHQLLKESENGAIADNEIKQEVVVAIEDSTTEPQDLVGEKILFTNITFTYKRFFYS